MMNLIDSVSWREHLRECSTVAENLSDAELSAKQQLLKNLYEDIKAFSKCFELGALDFDKNDTNSIIKILDVLLSTMCDSEIAIEISLLAGTCFATFIYQLFGTSQAVYCFISLLCYNDANKSSKCDDQFECDSQSDLSKTELDRIFSKLCCSIKLAIANVDELLKTELMALKQNESFLISLLYGILSCQSSDMLLFKIQRDHVLLPFFLHLFNCIVHALGPPCKFPYHVFHVMLLWTRLVPMLLAEIYSDPNSRKNECHYFGKDSTTVQKVLNILEANWENPINGISEIVKSIYKALFEANLKEKQLTDSKDEMLQFLLMKTMQLSWAIKGKYIVLSTLLLYTSPDEFLEEYSDAPSSIIRHMQANYMASVIGDVYKILAFHKSTEAAEKIWYTQWAQPITEGLLSSNKLVVQNIKNYILPCTIRKLPNAFSILTKVILDNGGNDMAEIVLLRIAKECDIPLDRPKIYEVIGRKLPHGCEHLRLEVFSILCFSTKKSEPLDFVALELIKQFLAMNLNIDNSAFNHRMMSQMKILLARIRDSCVCEMNTVNRSKGDYKSFYIRQIEFIDWLARIALQNTYPGACYQRRRTCLQILDAVFDCFLVPLSAETKKAKPSSKVPLLISHAQSHGLWMFFKDGSLLQILPCLLDFTEDIRSMTTAILSKFYHWPDISNSQCDVIDAQSLMKYAFELINSFHVQHTDSGSLICEILFTRYIIERELWYDFNESIYHTKENSPASSGLNFITCVVENTVLQLENLDSDFLNGALSAPIHGMLLAIRRCLSCENFLEVEHQKNSEDTIALINSIINLCQNVIHHMLTIMGGSTNADVPSFGDIGVALDSLLPYKKCSTNESSETFSTMCLFGSEENDLKSELSQSHSVIGIDNYALSPEFQLLLSCCWHSIKNSCFLLSEIIKPILHFDTSSYIQRNFMESVMEILSSTLLKCRHKGVIEACSAALNQCCQSILSIKKDFGDILLKLLHNCFNTMWDSSSISVTRRSAGLPLLIQAIVSLEERNYSEKLITFTVQKTLEIINIPLEEEYNEKNDTHQAHCFHILKTLVSDAKLYHRLNPWIGDIVISCISGFSSKSWAIRNGALQLFGVLLPRLCGQKKTKEDSQHNLIHPNELFARCPNLYSFLLRSLQKTSESHKTMGMESSSALVPLLSLIAKLSPTEENEINKKYIEDFKPLLLNLLGSPLWTVRNLTSSALSIIISADAWDLAGDIHILLNENSSNNNNNVIHGCLLTVQKSIPLSLNNQVDGLLNLLNDKCITFLKSGVWCGMNCSLLLSIMSSYSDFNCLQNIKQELLTMNNIEVNSSVWKEQYYTQYLKICNSDEAVDFVTKNVFLGQGTFNSCLMFLTSELMSSRTKFEIHHWKIILNYFAENLIEKCFPSLVEQVLTFIISLCSKSRRTTCEAFVLDCDISLRLLDCMKKLMSGSHGLSVSSFALTVASLSLNSNLSCELTNSSLKLDLNFWISTFCSFCPPRKSEIYRFHAADFIATAGYAIVKYLVSQIEQNVLYSEYLIRLCDGCLHLLVDEEEEIRKKASVFVSRLPHKYEVSIVQFNAAISFLCYFMADVLGSQECFLQFLWCKFHCFLSTSRLLHARTAPNKIGLFEQEYINIFAEPVELALLHYSQLLMTLERHQEKNDTLWLAKIEMFGNELRHCVGEAMTVLDEFKLKNSSVAVMSYLSQSSVFLALLNLNCKVQALLAQKQVTFPKELKENLEILSSELKNIKKFFLPTIQWITPENVFHKHENCV